MSAVPRRFWLGLALVSALAILIGSVVLVAGYGRSPRATGIGAGMMGGGTGGIGGTGRYNGAGAMGALWLAGDGAAVTSISGARARAATAAAPQGLHPGEVIWFANGFYVELKDASGHPATEVIVDVTSGAVSTEPGPAMMWNTRYGMHGVPGGTATVSADRAQRLATTWLDANLPGRRVGESDAYPGYYTMETTTGAGTINGMLSVNSSTGAVWYHSWHGRFIAREDT